MGEVEAVLRMAVVETASPTRWAARPKRLWQLGVVSPVAALLVLLVLTAPLMLRVATVATAPELTTNTSVGRSVGVAWPLDPAEQVELGSISTTGILVDGHRDPHRVDSPSRLLPGIDYR
jgi:hypothetical protein